MPHLGTRSALADLVVQRESAEYPGLALELNAPFLIFRAAGKPVAIYDLAGGQPLLIGSSRETYRDMHRYCHMGEVAMAYARALARKPWRVALRAATGLAPARRGWR